MSAQNEADHKKLEQRVDMLDRVFHAAINALTERMERLEEAEEAVKANLSGKAKVQKTHR